MSEDLDAKAVEFLRELADDIEAGEQSIVEFELSRHFDREYGLMEGRAIPTGTYDAKLWMQREEDGDE